MFLYILARDEGSLSLCMCVWLLLHSGLRSYSGTRSPKKFAVRSEVTPIQEKMYALAVVAGIYASARLIN